MELQLIVVDSYFDGETLHNKGPYTLALRGELIEAINVGDFSQKNDQSRRATFLMPGLVEAHSHLFLDGGELDLNKRAEYLTSQFDEMIKVGRRSVAQSLAAGITLIRDAGDIHGINLQLRSERKFHESPQPAIRCAGQAIRKAKRYGSFMAREVRDAREIEDVVSEAAIHADDIKVLMTGIIDFDAGEVKGAPQFSLEEARCIAAVARSFGRLTFAHCSGADGINIAIEAGLNSIEHGFFMTREQLQKMAKLAIAWVPTFSPVNFQKERPELLGWSAQTVDKLDRILEAHWKQLEYAYEIGVPVLVGSDAGSIGVRHGLGYIEELILMASAGVKLTKILHSATVLPRKLWHCAPVDIKTGAVAEIVLLDSSPFDDISALERIVAVYKDGCFAQMNVAKT